MLPSPPFGKPGRARSRRLSQFPRPKAGLSLCSAPVTEEVKKNNLRRTLLAICVGVILGFAGASARGPELVSLLFKPLQDSFSCSGSVNLALTQFVRLQLTCAVLGGLIGGMIFFLWRRFFRRRAEARQSRGTPG